MQEEKDKGKDKLAIKIAETLVQKLKEKSLTLALAESCTGGLASSLITEVPGASKVLFGSFVCYTQEAKVSMLDVDNNTLTVHGLVSGETARSMALGALRKSGADIAASVTGVAGPAGDGSPVPVGTVWTAVARKNGAQNCAQFCEIAAKEFHFTGSRNEVRLKAAVAVFEMILEKGA